MFKRSPYIPILLRVPIFHGLDDESIQSIAEIGTVIQKPRGSFIFQQGDLADHLVVILSGMIRLVEITPDGDRIIIRHASPGEIIGVIAVLGGFKYPLSAEVVEDAKLWTCSGDDFKRVLVAHPAVTLNVIQMLTGRIRELLHKIQEFATEKVEQRLAREILRIHHQMAPEGNEITIKMTNEELAQMAGTTLYTVSRIVTKWERSGIVRTGRGKLTVVDAQRLIQITRGPEGTAQGVNLGAF